MPSLTLCRNPALRTTIIDDSLPAITYSDGWAEREDAGTGYYNVTARRSTMGGSEMEVA